MYGLFGKLYISVRKWLNKGLIHSAHKVKSYAFIRPISLTTLGKNMHPPPPPPQICRSLLLLLPSPPSFSCCPRSVVDLFPFRNFKYIHGDETDQREENLLPSTDPSLKQTPSQMDPLHLWNQPSQIDPMIFGFSPWFVLLAYGFSLCFVLLTYGFPRGFQFTCSDQMCFLIRWFCYNLFVVGFSILIRCVLNFSLWFFGFSLNVNMLLWETEEKSIDLVTEEKSIGLVELKVQCKTKGKIVIFTIQTVYSA